jgi:glycerol-1-phosphatase
MKLSAPKNLVTAEDVPNGKPDPACYALGRSRLGFTDSAEMLVFEDAPAGIRAGKAAGCKVVGLTTTHSIRQVREAGADWIVQDLQSVVFKGVSKETGKVVIEIRDAFRD